MALRLVIVVGSTRPGRKGISVARWFAEAAREQGAFEVELVDLADIDLPLLDEPEHPKEQRYIHEHTKRWAATIARADAVVLVTPEYDYFAPASLVNAIQYLSREWQYKPVGIVSYGGVSGGLRSTQTVRLLLVNLDAHPLKDGVSIQFVAKHINDGDFDPPAHAPGAAASMLGELHRWAGALKKLRTPQ